MSYFPYIGIDAEIALGKKIAVIASGGPIVKFAQPSFVNGQTARDRKGIVLNPAIKMYIDQHHPGNNQQFISADYLYRDATFTIVETYFNPTNSLVEYQDTIGVRNKTMGFTINYGQMLYFGNFGLEFSIGAGASFMKNHRSDEINAQAAFSGKKFSPFWQHDSYWAPRFPLRYRLFFRF